MTATCGPLIVGPDADEGEPCYFVGEGEGWTYVECGEGLWCSRFADEPWVGTCVSPIAAGGECADANGVCVPNHECVSDGDMRACRPTTCAVEGESCDEVQCDPHLPLACRGLDLVCMMYGDGSFESVCDRNSVAACQEALYCSARSICEYKREAGFMCRGSGHWCLSGCCLDGACT